MPKLREIIHTIFDLKPIEQQLTGLNACFFCLGVLVRRYEQRGISAHTYDLTRKSRSGWTKLNQPRPFAMSRCTHYSSEQERCWARVKGATENAVLRLFKRAYSNVPPRIL